MHKWDRRTTVVTCPGPVENPEPGRFGPHWALIALYPVLSVPPTEQDRESGKHYSVLAVATWEQSGEVEEDDKPSGCDVEAAGRT